MLLVIDVGNTNTVLGVYDRKVLVDHWRIGTEREKTADEWGILFRDLFQFDKIDIRDLKGMIISSVVPPVLDMLQRDGGKIFSCQASDRWAGYQDGNAASFMTTLQRWEQIALSTRWLPMSGIRDA